MSRRQRLRLQLQRKKKTLQGLMRQGQRSQLSLHMQPVGVKTPERPNLTQLNSTQLNPTQLKSTRTKLNPTQLNPT